MVKEPSYEAMVLYNEGDRVEISEPRITRGRGKVVGTVISGPDESETYMIRGEAENSKAAQLYGGVHGKFLTLVETPVPDPEPTPPSAVDHPSHYGGEDDSIRPQHYKFSNGVEVVDISENLTSNGGQAVQYIARATRIDGRNKQNPIEDLQKALWFIQREIERIDAKRGV